MGTAVDQDNPYAAPKAELLESEQLPQLDDWSPVRLRLLGWLEWASMLGSLVVIALSFSGMPTARVLNDWFSPAVTLLSCFLLLRLKAFIEARFAARGLGWPVWLNLLLGIALEALQSLLGDRLGRSDALGLIYFALLVFLGVAILWLGVALLRVRQGYAVLRLMGWLQVIGGVAVTTVVLFVVALLPLLAASAAAALVFFQGARELERQSERLPPSS